MENIIDMKALFSLSYGMYIVSTASEGKFNGQIANAVMQITADPIHITTCLNKANMTCGMIQQSGFFGISVLELDVPMTFLGLFGFKSGRDIYKFADTKYIIGPTGAPLVTDWSLSVFDAKVTGTIELPTHILFVGEIISASSIKDAKPLTYADYHLVKKGKSPKTAPTFGFNTLK